MIDWTKIKQRTRLSKEFFMRQGDNLLLTTNVMSKDGQPAFCEHLEPLEGRDEQWGRIRQYNGQTVNVFDGKKELKEFISGERIERMLLLWELPWVRQ